MKNLYEHEASPEQRERRRRLTELLERLPVLESRRKEVWYHAQMIQAWGEIERSGNARIAPADRRKPVAWTTTEFAASAYEALTGKSVTRTSRKVAGARGLQETGDFAKFLGEVLAILDIKASAAGQVALLMKARRKR